ncbi:MAG: 16S rRNA (guanine(527)-N(7))-methyltransferase RsmG [Planctomycetota bacterium]
MKRPPSGPRGSFGGGGGGGGSGGSGGSGGGRSGGGRRSERRDMRPRHSNRGDGPSRPHRPKGPNRPARAPHPADSAHAPSTGGAGGEAAGAPEQRPLVAAAPLRLTPEQRAEIVAALQAYARDLELPPPPGGWADFLVRFQEHILGFNQTVNLTAIKEPLDFLVRHHLDSLATVRAVPALRLPAPLEVLDVGTGAGFPGLPLWAALPQHRYTLIDGTTKKVRCLEQALRVALDETTNEGLRTAGGEAPLDLLAERAELLPRADPRRRGAYDLALARAAGPGLEIFENVQSLLKPGGRLVLFFTDHPGRGEAELLREMGRRELACNLTPTFELLHGAVKMVRRHCVITLPV